MSPKQTAVQRPRRASGTSRLCAFTLVELLVVIGIIALLIGILLPSLAHAREVANHTKCASQLHQMMLAAALHASSHKGYYPLAGVLPGSQGAGLDDLQNVRYTYLSDTFQGFTRMLAPITTALAGQMQNREQLSGTVTNDQLGNLERDPTDFIKYFTCPAQRSAIKGVNNVGLLYTGAVSANDTQAPTSGTIIEYSQFQSYVYNEYVLGFDDPSLILPFPKLRGKADAVRSSAQTMFAMDGLEEKKNTAEGDIPSLGMYTVYVKPTVHLVPPIKLSDAYDADIYAGDTSNFDKIRHQGKIEIAFCDGHVETRTINDGDLRTVYIVPP